MDFDASPAAVDDAPACGVEPLRDPRPLLRKTLDDWQRHHPGGDFWVFGYASLIWRPEFAAAEQRRARVHGHHRALQMRSRINRGTPQVPGLVFALVAGGSCAGMVYRIERARVEAEMQRLWDREMPTGVYDPKWLPCQTAQGPVRALAFTLSRSSPSYTGELDDASLLGILRHARGKFGSTLDYLVETGCCLRKHGIRDATVERQLALARAHGLVR
ncbi:MAG TPA: gamma-glutamylcyclotransferase [Methylibium sp.]|uniref:gamma-glutamylcyclotransferase n=1 Tax=Methylibium sp. TaxID=2067992 RepID=UPI002DBCF225|nr:gamma-glutamylcyclotransferase [Methylibium sp.]HEU4457555.1 gamma-glutamylcyclotransferase [Methylibium sp.]